MQNILLIIFVLTQIFFLSNIKTTVEQIPSVPLEAPQSTTTEEVIEVVPVPKNYLTHAQEVWIYALEWCESRGKTTAINKMDRDGTPSYFSFQFKPGTFAWLGQKYGVTKLSTELSIMEQIKDYDLQRDIVENMVQDSSTNWEQQFPACVQLLGRPPKY